MSPASALLNPALDSGEGLAFEQARLRDRQGMAVLLQGAALLSHLEHAGWCLLRGWETSRVTPDALLRVSDAGPGRGFEATPSLLVDLIRRVGLWNGRGRILGKGAAKRAAAQLLGRWNQPLAPEAPDQAVAEILDRAPFLWQPEFAEARLALLAEHFHEEASHLWIAGPGRHRRRLVTSDGTRSQVAALLAGEAAQDLWEGYREDEDPMELARRGRRRQAVGCWRRKPPTRRDEVLLYGRCLFELGWVAQAEEVIRRRPQFEALLLRLKCLGELGRSRSVRHMLFRLAKRPLNAPETVAVAEVAVRLLAFQGDEGKEMSREWVQRAFQSPPNRVDLRLRAQLLAAEAAWDEQQFDTTARYLSQASAALDQPDLARRWHEVRSLLALGHRDGRSVIEHSTEALCYRREMTPIEAGRRWNDLAYGRLLMGDLAGAERAILHTRRLLAGTESAARSTLGMANLAGIRLRRGCLEGVAETLEAATKVNADNAKGRLGDLGLWVRFELAQGRPEEALSRCHEAFELIGRYGVGDRQEFDLFAARAHGLLDAPERAAAHLTRVGPEIFFELEPEERPAVWALAARPEQAAREAIDTPWEALWSAHAAELHPGPRVWESLAELEEFRAARLVYDYLMVSPDAVPPMWMRRAIDGLRKTGAYAFASRLEKRFFSPWSAVDRFLESREPGPTQITELFDSAGFPEVRLVYSHRDREMILKPGRGGPKVLQEVVGEGRLVLEAPRHDPALRVLFQLVRLRFTPPAKRTQSTEGHREGNELLGESPAWRKTLDKLERLARGELPILILGESGTGKEGAARHVHNASPRSQGPFEPVNCAGLPEDNLAQSKIFGHVKGAYTGAHKDRRGVFEVAQRGTVFLDEIGDLPLELQGKLLRVLQEGEVHRLGDELVRKVDVRVVAATNRDLAAMIRDGRFRKDLYYRLRGASVELPRLDQRGHDILILAEHFLRRYWQRLELRHTSPPEISAAARRHLLSHCWPGNVRELRQTIEMATTLAVGRDIEVDDLGLEVEQAEVTGGYFEEIERLQSTMIRQALEKSGGNQARAARLLGMTRQAFSYHARKLGLI